MGLFDKIICPIDFSEQSVRALQFTQVLARQFHSQVIVLYVMQTYSARVEASAEKFPEEITESMREFLTPLEVEYEILLSSGEPWQKITALSQGLDATLIVMSTRGLTGPRHKLLGSTTENVVRASATPVLTLSPDCTTPPVAVAGRVLFPVCHPDAAPPNYVSLRGVLREIATSTSLLHCVESRESPAQREEGIARKKELLRIGGLLSRESVETIVRSGSPCEQIILEIETGSHDYVLLNVKKAGPLSRFVESTVYTVISHSKIPVFSLSQSF